MCLLLCNGYSLNLSEDAAKRLACDSLLDGARELKLNPAKNGKQTEGLFVKH